MGAGVQGAGRLGRPTPPARASTCVQHPTPGGAGHAAQQGGALGEPAPRARPPPLPVRRSGLAASEIDNVEILGGGSRIPRVQAMLQEALGGRALDKHMDADEAVREGVRAGGGGRAGRRARGAGVRVGCASGVCAGGTCVCPGAAHWGSWLG